MCEREAAKKGQKITKVTRSCQGLPGFHQGVPGFHQGVPGFDQGVPGFDQGVPGFDQGLPGFLTSWTNIGHDGPG